MSLQTYFKEFNKVIKMDYDVKSELKEKRDILLGILRNDDDMPAFDEYNQGSYSMHLGVEPLDKEYDIDVGLRFHVNRDDYEPMDLKEKIRDLLKNHTEYGAKIKKPCVTVTYKKDGEAAYHVDLVTYVYEDKDDSDSQLYLARGKNRDSEETCWEKSDPVGLVEYVNDKYKGDDNKEDREQFRRVVRYIKRWKNKKFSSSGNAEPPSIAITLIAVDHFEASKKYDYIEEKYCYDDLQAVISFAKEIQKLFVFKEVNENGRLMYTIEYNLPSSLNFESDVNLFRKMSDNYMTDFKEKTSYCMRGQIITESAGGCGKTYVPYGNLVSLKTMLLCLKMVKNIFEENLDDNLLISLKGDSDYLEKHNLETSGRYLRQQEQIKILTGKQFVNINCGVCNDCNGK